MTTCERSVKKSLLFTGNFVETFTKVVSYSIRGQCHQELQVTYNLSGHLVFLRHGLVNVVSKPRP